MRAGRERVAIATAVIAGAAGACGLFPDLGGLTAEDASLVDVHPPEVGPNETGPDTTSDVTVADTSSADVVDAGPVPCPSGRGPNMVHLDPHTCIDTTEVTVAQYRAFLASVDGGAVAQPAECSFNGNAFTPLGGMPSTSKDTYPIANINWCQAYAFCEWSGKSLCGAFDGGAVPFVSFTNSAQSVWMSACSADGTQAYPYGAVFEAGACNLGLADANSPVAPAGAYTQCVGSLPGMVDMVGNIKEWENSCAPAGTGDAAADLCRRRGSGFDDKGNAALKTCAWDETDTRDHQSWTSGVRCCAITP